MHFNNTDIPPLEQGRRDLVCRVSNPVRAPCVRENNLPVVQEDASLVGGGSSGFSRELHSVRKRRERFAILALANVLKHVAQNVKEHVQDLVLRSQRHPARRAQFPLPGSICITLTTLAPICMLSRLTYFIVFAVHSISMVFDEAHHCAFARVDR